MVSLWGSWDTGQGEFEGRKSRIWNHTGEEYEQESGRLINICGGWGGFLGPLRAATKWEWGSTDEKDHNERGLEGEFFPPGRLSIFLKGIERWNLCK